MTFELDRPAAASAFYVLLGTLSGRSPGFFLPGPPGEIHVPLNIDAFTRALLAAPHNTVVRNFVGRLDGDGFATPQLVVPALPSLQGLTMDFAFVQDGTTWNFASNAVTVTITP